MIDITMSLLRAYLSRGHGGGGAKLIFLKYKLKNNLQFITEAYPRGGRGVSGPDPQLKFLHTQWFNSK
jgi:hypothetical protein